MILLLLLLPGCPPPKPTSPEHAAIARCESCHVSGPRSDARRCLICHPQITGSVSKQRGVHAWAANKKIACGDSGCHMEHNPVGQPTISAWRVGGLWPQPEDLRKDHGRVTEFPLSGRHSLVPCERCHPRRSKLGLRLYADAPLVCAGCHASPHGRVRPALADCRACHDLSSFRPIARPRFDHQRDARFPLAGAHQRTGCQGCHGKPARFQLDAQRSADCAPCHQSPHGGSFGASPCRSCHRPDSPFAQSSFPITEHESRTGFALSDHHQRACRDCHRPTDRKPPAPDCAACHQKDDPHAGRFARFAQCSGCHVGGSSWAAQALQHGPCFPLTANHVTKDLKECRKCHSGRTPAEFKVLHLAAAGCGPGRPFAVSCVGCHRTTHQADPLRRQTPCLTCHEHPGTEKMRACLDARGRVDLRCQAKLTAVGHGPGTPFPLAGGHALTHINGRLHLSAPCRACHSNASVPFGKLPTDCLSCHQQRQRDPHRGSLGARCERCHTPRAPRWRPASLFNHQTMSSYPLAGAHLQRAACQDCHKAPDRFKGTPRLCGDALCHKKDDVHKGLNGPSCGDEQRCHGSAHRPEHGRWQFMGTPKAQTEVK